MHQGYHEGKCMPAVCELSVRETEWDMLSHAHARAHSHRTPTNIHLQNTTHMHTRRVCLLSTRTNCTCIDVMCMNVGWKTKVKMRAGYQAGHQKVVSFSDCLWCTLQHIIIILCRPKTIILRWIYLELCMWVSFSLSVLTTWMCILVGVTYQRVYHPVVFADFLYFLF